MIQRLEMVQEDICSLSPSKATQLMEPPPFLNQFVSWLFRLVLDHFEELFVPGFPGIGLTTNMNLPNNCHRHVAMWFPPSPGDSFITASRDRTMKAEKAPNGYQDTRTFS